MKGSASGQPISTGEFEDMQLPTGMQTLPPAYGYDDVAIVPRGRDDQP